MSNTRAIVVIQFLALLQLHGVESNLQQLKLEKQIIDNIFSSANMRVRPSGVNSSSGAIKPLEVHIDMHIRKIHRLDDDKMLFSLDTVFRQQWLDERLKFNAINGMLHLNLNDDDDLWTPGLFFNDYRGSTHDVTTPNILVRIWPNGTVLHSKRYNLLLYCEMDFHDLPFDTQSCRMSIAAYAYQITDLLLRWKKQPITIAKFLFNDGLYSLEKFTSSETSSKTSTGEYSKLILSFDFNRVLHYYKLQLFMPCVMLVIMGYLPFWIGMQHFNTRMILAMATCYTLAYLVSNFNIELPRTAYPKAVDIFTGISISFTFAVVIETIIVYIVSEQGKQSFNTGNEALEAESTGAISNKPSVRTKLLKLWLANNSDHIIDVIAKIIYPGLFILFNIIYWGYYLL